MKYCPRCNFTFPDFHHVCDFDGSDLVSEPERPSLVNASKKPSLLRRYMKSPVLLAVIGLFAVVSSAMLIGYLDVVNQTKPVARTESSPTVSDATADATAPQSTEELAVTSDKHAKHSKRSTTASSHFSRREIASVRSTRIEPNPRIARSELVKQRTSERNSREKEPLLTAMLKTTWHVLKKPFKL